MRWSAAARRSTHAVVVVAVMGLWGARSGRAAEGPVEWRLQWDAPVVCPSATSLRARVAKLMAHADGPAAAAPITAEAQITAAADGRLRMRLRIETREGRGVREIEDSDCEVLTDAAALVIALAMNPNVLSPAVAPVLIDVAPSPRSPAPPPPKPQVPPAPPQVIEAPPPAPPPAPALAPQPRPQRRPSASAWWSAVRADAQIAHALLPALAVGPQLAVSVGRGRIYGEIGGVWFPARRAALGDDAFARPGGRIGLAATQGRLCLRWQRDRFAVGVCAGAEAGVLRGEGVDVAVARSGDEPWLALVQRVTVRVPIAAAGRLGLCAEAGIDEGLIRPRFILDDLGTVHRPGAVSVRAAIGFDWRWSIGHEGGGDRPFQ